MPCCCGEAMCRSEARLDGKTVLITGANTGIGKETAVDMARRGAKVLIACRSKSRADAAAEDIRERSGNQNVVVYILDLASLQSVRDCAAEVVKNEPRLNILINNAGLMWPKTRELTKEGFELQFGTNHLGHFLLTHLLLDLLKKSAPSRIVILSSMAHVFGKIEFDNLQSEKSFDKQASYAQSKLANLMHARMLAKRLKGSQVTVNAVHPGVIMTDLQRSAACIWRCLLPCMVKCFGKTVEEGAQTTIYCAVSEQTEGVSGKYFADVKEKAPARQALDDEVAERLWSVSENLVGIST